MNDQPKHETITLTTGQPVLSYLHVRQLTDGETVHKTIEVRDGLLIDIDPAGHVIGVESLDGPVDFDDLLAVVGHIRVAKATS